MKKKIEKKKLLDETQNLLNNIAGEDTANEILPICFLKK